VGNAANILLKTSIAMKKLKKPVINTSRLNSKLKINLKD